MNKQFQNKYRIASARAPWWDYSGNGVYFITICTANKVQYFGKIVKDNMQLSEIGKIAENEWIKTPEIRADMNITLDKFCVMPNHFHGILMIGGNKYNMDTKCNNQFGPQSKNLASVIRGFKIGVTKNARLINGDFAWQTRFYDNIIRNDEGYYHIKNYIETNPANWSQDKLFLPFL
ncbi:hypothetical protein HY745_14265 [Candidatus Desantisbacteria bacterium]|nr:hypothetical protein [Candidatus Desantisbacteria bacterium]